METCGIVNFVFQKIVLEERERERLIWLQKTQLRSDTKKHLQYLVQKLT
jgi:hypothetical protein